MKWPNKLVLFYIFLNECPSMVWYSKNYSKIWSLLQAHVVYHKPTISEKCSSFQFFIQNLLQFVFLVGTASVKINLHNLFFSFSNFQLCWCWKLWIISTIIFFITLFCQMRVFTSIITYCCHFFVKSTVCLKFDYPEKK